MIKTVFLFFLFFFYVATEFFGRAHTEEQLSWQTLTFRHLYGFATDSIPENWLQKFTSVQSSVSLRRQLGHEVLQWLAATSSEGKLPRFLLWMDEAEMLFHLQGLKAQDIEPKLITEEFLKHWLNEERKNYQYSPHWNVSEFTFWNERNGELAWQVGHRGFPRLLYNFTFFHYLAKNQAQLKNCFVDFKFPLSCHAIDLPLGAAVLKLEWRRERGERPLTFFDVSLPALEQLLLAPQGFWPMAQQEKVDLFVGKRSDQQSFSLVGMHFMLKLSADWFWGTMWPSHSDQTFRELGPISNTYAPFNQYAYCFVSHFNELDTEHPLGKVVYALNGGQQWCSNPYLEDKPGGVAATNCIGCHQYAGELYDGSTIVNSKPNRGQAQELKFFPADYLWSFTQYPHEIGFKLLDL